jgi:anti-sigma factor RsiW
MSEACPERRGDLAMAALGRLDSDQRGALLRHSASCPGCRAALIELQETALLLPVIDASRLAGVASRRVPTPGVRTGQGSSRSWRLPPLRWLTPTAAALAAGALATALLLAPGKPLQLTVSLRGAPQAHASAVLTATSWGTEIHLTASGQPNGQVFTVSMESRSGYWWQAGSYRTAVGRTDVSLACAAATSQIERVLVRNSEGRIVLQAHIA